MVQCLAVFIDPKEKKNDHEIRKWMNRQPYFYIPFIATRYEDPGRSRKALEACMKEFHLMWGEADIQFGRFKKKRLKFTTVMCKLEEEVIPSSLGGVEGFGSTLTTGESD